MGETKKNPPNRNQQNLTNSKLAEATPFKYHLQLKPEEDAGGGEGWLWEVTGKAQATSVKVVMQI